MKYHIMIYNDDDIVNYVPYIHNTMLAVETSVQSGRHGDICTIRTVTARHLDNPGRQGEISAQSGPSR